MQKIVPSKFMVVGYRETRHFIILMVVLCCQVLPYTVLAQRRMESIDRGLVAIKTGTGVFLSWRILGNEFSETGFNLYRNGSKIASLSASDASNFNDATGTLASIYTIKSVLNGVEQSESVQTSVWPNIFKLIPLNRPAIGPQGGSYEPNDCSTGDLDGDGQYELVLKWQPTNSHDNANDGNTDNTYLDAYELNGTFLWRIDLGKNIRSGAHYTQFLVYDLNGDGKAELVSKTAPGTIDGTGSYLSGAASGTDQTADYRNLAGRVLSGPEYLTVFNGQTGKEQQTILYEPVRGLISDWGDDYGNRCDRFLACVAYLNGKTPSVVMCRGYYGKTVLVAYSWNGTELTKIWKFDSAENPTYEGQGNHNLSFADVDDDGCDELIYGSCTIDHDGMGKYSTNLKHGDALHVGDLDPDRPGLEVWQAHEESSTNGGTGASFRDAKTGEVLFQDPASTDIGRGLSANFLPTIRGDQFWSVASSNLWSCQGLVVGNTPPTINPLFAAYWDGNDQREIIDGASCSSFTTGRIITFYNFGNAAAVSGSKNHPCLQADILGDWREEEIYRSSDNTKLVVFSTTIPTARRVYTLMHDPVYRMGVAWQNVAYNQPPHTGFYIGTGMGPVPPSTVIGEDVRWSGNSAVWDADATQSWITNTTSTAFHQHQKVLFDQYGLNGTITNNAATIVGSVTPDEITVSSSIDYTFSGSGMITGSTKLTKNGSGKLTINNANTFTGSTVIWDGSLLLNGTSTSPVTVNGGIWGGVSTKGLSGAVFGGTGTLQANLFANERGGISPSAGMGGVGKLSIAGNTYFQKSSYCNFDVSNTSVGAKDTLSILGDLQISDTIFLNINRLNGNLESGYYPLIQYTGTLVGNPATIILVGLEGVPNAIYQSGNTIGVQIKSTRLPSKVTWSGLGDSWDLATTRNWMLNGSTDVFVPQDSVIFNGPHSNFSSVTPPTEPDGGEPVQGNGSYHTTITIPAGATLPLSDLLFDADTTNFNIVGEGSITGPGGLAKNGTGIVSMLTKNGYTGKTRVLGGCLTIGSLTNAGQFSSIGATTSTSPTFLELDNAILRYGLLPTVQTKRGLTLSGTSDTFDIDRASVYWKGMIAGTGKLVKTGLGALILQQQANTFTGGVLVKEGTLRMGDDLANRCGMGPQTSNVTLEGGTLSLYSSDSYNNTYFNLIVPTGSTANYFVDYRSDNYGSLTGSGTLNLHIPYVRSTLFGDWSAFSGKLNVYFDSQGSSSSGDFRINNNYGYANAAIQLMDSQVSMYHLTGASVAIGELSGVSGSKLSGSNWIIGAKNTDATYNGKIVGNSLTKVGTGTFILTDSCLYTNATIVDAGRLIVDRTAGLKGGITVNRSGTLGGSGAIAGASTIHGRLEGSLRFGSSLTMTSTSTTDLQITGFGNEQHDTITVSGSVSFGGQLNVTVPSFAPPIGTRITLISASSFSGSYASINCPGYSFDATNGILTYTGHHVSGQTSFSAASIPSNASLTVDDGLFTIDKAGTLSTMVLMPGSKLSLKSGTSLPSTNLQIRSDSAATATYVNANLQGQSISASVQQYLRSGRNWYISIPVNSVDSMALSASAKAIIQYDEPTASWKSPTNSNLIPMKGYISVATKMNGPVTFNGMLNDGNQTTTLTRTFGVAKSGFNLVGNPYPSYVSWDDAEKSNIEPTIWYRTKNSTNTAYVFDTYNSLSQLGTGNNGERINGHIPPMQAFWVRVKAPTLEHDTVGTLTFQNTMRSHKGFQDLGVIVPDVSLRASSIQVSKQKFIRLVLSNDAFSDEVLVTFNASASNGLDAFDSFKMSNSNSDQPEIYTKVGSENLVINGLRQNESGNDTIPLYMTIGKPAVFSIKATEICNFDSTEIYLRDQLMNTEFKLSDEAYHFLSSVAKSSNRFSLLFKQIDLNTSMITANIPKIDVYTNNNHQIMVKVTGSRTPTSEVLVYNVIGQKISTMKLTTDHAIVCENTPAGVYVVNVKTGNERTIKKVIVNE